MNNRFGMSLPLCTLLLATSSAFAQGIPVMDLANITQSILIVKGQIDQLTQLTQAVTTAQSQLNAMTGGRGMASLADTAGVRQILPPGFMSAADSMRRLGAAGASNEAKSIYEAVKRFGCDEQFPLSADLRKMCEAKAYMAPTTISLLQDSVKRAQERADKLGSMVNSIDTTDAKAAMDLQNRIAIESAMLNNEKILMDMALQNQQAQKDLLAQQQKEEGVKRLQRKGDPGDLFK
jgi:type IV secretion system protein VirB5